MDVRRKVEPWALTAPGLLLFTIFGLGPVVMAAVGSVYDGGMFGRGWIGLDAVRAVAASEVFWRSLWNTVRLMAWVLPANVLGAVAIAVVLGWARPALRAFARTALFLPGVVSAVMVAVTWRWLVGPGGPVSVAMGMSGGLVSSGPWAFRAVAVMVLSVSLGQPVLYFMAALAAVDPELYEAARLDGCGPVREAVHVTVPAIAPVVGIMSVVRAAGLMQTWQFPYAVTGGGPDWATTTAVLHVYKVGFQYGRMAEASVESVALVVVVGGLVVLARLVSGNGVLR